MSNFLDSLKSTEHKVLEEKYNVDKSKGTTGQEVNTQGYGIFEKGEDMVGQGAKEVVGGAENARQDAMSGGNLESKTQNTVEGKSGMNQTGEQNQKW